MSDQNTAPNNNAAPVENSAPVEEKAPVNSTINAPKDTKQQVQDAAKAEAKKYLKKLNLKIDGEELEEELPFEIPDDPKAIEYMRRELQKAKAFHKRDSYSKQLESDLRQLVQDLKENPEAVLSDPLIGHDMKKLAAKIIEREIEASKKTPEQRRAEELEAKLKQLEEEREKERQEKQKLEFERLQEREFSRYKSEIENTLKKHGLHTEYAERKMADLLLIGLENGLQLTPEDVIGPLKEQIHRDVKAMFGASPDDMIQEWLGKERFQNLRKKVSAPPPVPVDKALKDVAKPVEEKKPAKKQSFKEFFK